MGSKQKRREQRIEQSRISSGQQNEGLGENSPKRGTSPLIGAAEVDGVDQVVLLHPADCFDERHGPDEFKTCSRFANHLDHWLGDELQTHGPDDGRVMPP